MSRLGRNPTQELLWSSDRGVRKSARMFVWDWIARKTDRAQNKGGDVVVLFFQAQRG